MTVRIPATAGSARTVRRSCAGTAPPGHPAIRCQIPSDPATSPSGLVVNKKPGKDAFMGAPPFRQLTAVGHIDADCFYVSAERVRDAFLCGKPVGVLGNQGACVIAKSYEMKAAGVQTGEPVWEARRKCPQGVYLKRDFRWYEALSRAMLAAVRAFFDKVEFYSVDEFFFEAVPLPGHSLQATAESIRDHIWRTIRVPVTVGIARSKSLAELVSDTAKPFGALALEGEQAEKELLAQLPVTEVTGIGRRRADRLARHGIRTCLDFAQADRRFIRHLLTIVGEALWWELNGELVQPLHTSRPPHKSL